jgi:hypothetical protein
LMYRVRATRKVDYLKRSTKWNHWVNTVGKRRKLTLPDPQGDEPDLDIM